ncbi:MAG: hypothetical protein RL154_769, partial [Pseudomonadota bacterium]
MYTFAQSSMRTLVNWLKSFDPCGQSREIVYKSLYLFIIMFMANAIIKPTYVAFYFFIAMFAAMNYENSELQTFKEKDYALFWLYILSCFVVFAMCLLWLYTGWFILFVFIFYITMMGYAVTKKPTLILIVMEATMIGLFSIKSYGSGNIYDAINRLIDISCAVIIAFWALKLYPNIYNKIWQRIWACFFRQIIIRLDSNNYQQLISLRFLALKLNHLLLSKPKYFNYYRFNLQCLEYHNFIEEVRLRDISPRERSA